MLNITQVHSGIVFVGYVCRALSLATSFASVLRNSPGETRLRDIPLHLNELAKLTVTYKTLVHFAFEVAGLLGEMEYGPFPRYSRQVSRPSRIHLGGEPGGVHEILASSLGAFVASLVSSPSPLSPRPALFFLGYIESSISIVDHTAWSALHGSRAGHRVDVGTFVRWMKYGGLAAAREGLLAVAAFDHKVSERLVCGSNTEMKGKLQDDSESEAAFIQPAFRISFCAQPPPIAIDVPE